MIEDRDQAKRERRETLAVERRKSEFSSRIEKRSLSHTQKKMHFYVVLSLTHTCHTHTLVQVQASSTQPA